MSIERVGSSKSENPFMGEGKSISLLKEFLESNTFLEL